MWNYTKSEQEFIVCEDQMKVCVKFRNACTHFLNPTKNYGTAYLKIVAEKLATLNKPEKFFSISNRSVTEPLEFQIDAIIDRYRAFEISKPKKISKAEKQKIVKDNQILSAKKYLKMGIMPKVVSMYTKLKLSKIYSLKRKIRENKPILDQQKYKRAKLTRAHLSYFLDVMKLSKFNMMTIKELKNEFLKRFGLPDDFITVSGLRKGLKKKIKLRWKKISKYKKAQIDSKTVEERKNYINRIIPHIYIKKNLIYLDECSFNLNFLRNKGWNIASKKIYAIDEEKSCNYSLLGAISDTRILGFLVSKGAVLTEIYSYFIICLIDLLREEKNIENSVIVADNALIHRNNFTQRMFSGKINIQYLPPYSPELNPIELTWSKWKREVRRKGYLKSEDDLIIRIFSAAKEIKVSDCQGWFRHSVRFYKKCLFGQNFY